MPQRLQTRIDTLSAIACPAWVPVTERATWRRLPVRLRQVLTGSKPANADEVIMILSACDADKRAEVIRLLRGRDSA